MTVKENPNNNVRQYLILNIGEHYFAADVHHIEDVIRCRKTTPVPLSKKNITGVLNLRGHIVTEIDVAITLDIKSDNTQKYIIVICVESEFYSLSFDGIGDVINIEENDILPVPETVEKKWHHVAKGIYRDPNNLFVLLDLSLFIDMAFKEETSKIEEAI